MMSLSQLALLFFVVTNPIGNAPAILALLKDFDVAKQQRILLRESLFSMILAVVFLFLGETFLSRLQVADYALTMSGGVLLFIVALRMIFVDRRPKQTKELSQIEPFIVPIATPLLSGAGLLTMIMLQSKREANDTKVFFAICMAWVGITAVLVLSPYLQVLFGKRGMAALEQLMGMLLAMVSMEMIVKGTALFIAVLSTTNGG